MIGLLLKGNIFKSEILHVFEEDLLNRAVLAAGDGKTVKGEALEVIFLAVKSREQEDLGGRFFTVVCHRFTRDLQVLEEKILHHRRGVRRLAVIVEMHATKSDIGKTAIAEGLATRIAEGNVPAKLQDKEIFLLDFTAIPFRFGSLNPCRIYRGRSCWDRVCLQILQSSGDRICRVHPLKNEGCRVRPKDPLQRQILSLNYCQRSLEVPNLHE